MPSVVKNFRRRIPVIEFGFVFISELSRCFDAEERCVVRHAELKPQLSLRIDGGLRCRHWERKEVHKVGRFLDANRECEKARTGISLQQWRVQVHLGDEIVGRLVEA